MSRAERQYVRVYHDDLQRDYPAVYADDAALATWLRLLVVADKMWPSVAELPRSVRPRALVRLTESGLVELLPAHCYRIRGLDTERIRRQDAARNAAGVRWHSDRNAEVMPSRDLAETEPNLPPPPAERGRRMDGTNPRATAIAPRQVGANPRANGHSPRQERAAEKRAGLPPSVHEILRRAAAVTDA